MREERWRMKVIVNLLVMVDMVTSMLIVTMAVILTTSK